MYERSDLQYLQDILDSAEAAIEFNQGCDHDTFSRDRKTRSATIRELEVIGEAAGKISSLIKDAYPHIPWRTLKDFRNVLSHEYFGINDEVVCDIVQHKLPELKIHIKQALHNEIHSTESSS